VAPSQILRSVAASLKKYEVEKTAVAVQPITLSHTRDPPEHLLQPIVPAITGLLHSSIFAEQISRLKPRRERAENRKQSSR